MGLESPESPVPATQLCEHCTPSGISPQAGLAARDPGLAREPPSCGGLRTRPPSPTAAPDGPSLGPCADLSPSATLCGPLN